MGGWGSNRHGSWRPGGGEGDVSVTLILKTGERLHYPDAERVDQAPHVRGAGAPDCVLITSGDSKDYKVHGEIALHEVASFVFG
jgi:hypothetical protein